ncbi:MAG: putative Ig domain-containing protein, partial [Myxococcota bacterium]
NLAPTLAAIGTQTVAEGAQLTFTVSATDPNTGDVMTYSASPIPSGATFDPATGTFTWTPNYTQAGSYTVTFTATDNGVPALSDSKQGVITVTNVNNAPILAFIGNKAVAEGANLTFVVSANDPNGDTVTLAAAPLPNNASFSPSTGTFTFNPAFGQAGTYSVTFTATDNGSPQMSDNETISIVVGAVNRAPTLANPGFQTIGEAATLAFNLSASDPDGNGLTYSATGLPTGATLNAATGAFSWTPTYLQAGSYQVTFIVTDDGAPNLSAQQSTTITVNNTNRAPVISPIANISSPEGTAISFTVSASDPDLDGVTLSASSLPAGATFNPSTGVFSWTPTYSQSGTYSPTFTATDDYNPTASSNATPTLTINNVPLTVVTAVSPNRGPSTGNTTVVVTAPGVNTGATVTVNALSATVQSVDEAAGTVTIRTPASLGTAALVDVVVTNPDTSTATGSNIFRYFYGQVTMTGSTYGAPWGVGGVALADMDLDLDLDVVISEHRCGTRVQVRYNDGSGDFPTASADFDPGFGGCNTNKVTTGDLDGDGRPDIILPQRWGNNVRVIRNPSTGLVMLSAVNVGIQNKGEPVVGDFDEDGRLDVFFLAGNGSVAFAKGAGDGTFSTITQWATGLNRVGHARAVDIDGDGNLDLVGKGYWDRVTSVLYGDGAGNFTTYNYTANIGGCRDALEVADNDLDGDIDIYGLTGCGNPGYVWRNNGDRNFTQVDVSSVNNDSREARRFDVDRDGTPDTFVSARCNSNTLTLSRGQGWPGTISASTAYLGYCTRTAAIGDINGDGKEDIVGGAGGGGVLQRWIVTSQ